MTRVRRDDPARRRIARIRWTTTLVFAAATAACLGILVAAALHIDLTSRAGAVDTDLRQRVSTLADLVTFHDDEQLGLGSVQESLAAKSVPAYGFVTDQAIAYAQPGQGALPDDAVLRKALGDARASHGDVVTFVAPSADDPDGPRLHWAAATITDLGHYVDGGFTGGIAVAGKPVAQAVGHEQLRTGLLLAAGALTVLAALLAHVVAGLAVRPAIRGLEQQEQFLVEAAHELRTPLATLRVLSERGAPPAQTVRQVDRLTALAERLLLRARSSTPASVQTEPLRLDQLVEQVVAERNGGGDLDVTFAGEPTVVQGDADLVEQIVDNLVRNAARHGAPPVSVTVRDHAVEVRDHGPGIPARERRTAMRAGTTSGAGTGTGLAIVAWAARAQGATLTLSDGDADDGRTGARRGLRATVRFRVPQTASSKPHRRRRSVDAGETKGA